MIWGEFINQVRILHVELLNQNLIQPKNFTADVELTTEGFPFPTAGDDYGDWDTVSFPENILEALEFHSVERALLEGPLLPIQEVIMNTENWDTLLQAILRLEKEWLIKTKLFSDDLFIFIEQNLRAKFLQLQRRSGRFSLRAI